VNTGAIVLTPVPQPVFYIKRILRVVDGDTFDCEVDKFHGITQRFRVRLLEVDTWEMSGPEKEKGIKAKVFTTAWLYMVEDLVVEGLHNQKLDSFGRLLAWVYNPSTGECLSNRLIEEGHGSSVSLDRHLEMLT
jgi:endonuclease YncB( thermonuclease family)